MTSGAWALCDRCGMRRRHAECGTEWTGAFVCGECRDPRPAWLTPPHIDPREGTPLKNARFEEPDDPNTFISSEDVVGDIDAVDPTQYPKSA